MDSRNEIIAQLIALKPALKKNYAVKAIGLFGSFATNSYTEKSDIDLLIELERPIGWKIFTLELYLEKIFGRKIESGYQECLKRAA